MIRRLTLPVLALLASAGASHAQTYKGFAAPDFITVGVNPSHAMPIDANGDGRLDLLVANMGRFDSPNTMPFPPSVQVLVWDSAAGRFVVDPLQVWTEGNANITQPLQIVKADLNGDGRLDAVFADGPSRTVKSLVFDPLTGRFFPPIASQIVPPPPVDPMEADPFAPGNVRSLDLGDLNGDGVPDVVTVQFTDPAFVPQVGRAFGDGAGGFTDNALFDARRPFALAVGDLNNDGLDDLVISHGGPISPVIDQDTDLSVMLNTSTVDPATGEIVISFMHTGVLGEGGSIQPFRFTAIDQFGNLSARDEPRVYPHSVELADLDGDGDLDIITTRSRKTHETTTGTPNGANPEGGETLGVIPGDPNDDNFDFINAATGVANNDYIAIFENLSIVCNGADLNGDGIVNGGDLSVILNLFGCAGGGAFTGDAGGSTPSAQSQSLMVAGPGSLYGFSSMDSYIQWLNALTPEEQIEHYLDLIDRLQRPQR